MTVDLWNERPDTFRVAITCVRHALRHPHPRRLNAIDDALSTAQLLTDEELGYVGSSMVAIHAFVVGIYLRPKAARIATSRLLGRAGMDDDGRILASIDTIDTLAAGVAQALQAWVAMSGIDPLTPDHWLDDVDARTVEHMRAISQ